MMPLLFVHFTIVCSARVIYESELMQDFLNSSRAENGKAAETTPPQERKVSLRVLLPDRTVCTVNIRDDSRTPEVFEVSLRWKPHLLILCVSAWMTLQEVAKKVKLGNDAKKLFALYERMEHDFGKFAPGLTFKSKIFFK